MDLLVLILIFIFGACIGSFLNVVIWRLPREEKLDGWSKCPHCHHRLEWYDLFPVFSYLIQGGKCRYCKAKISPRYWIIEIITGLLFVAAAYQFIPLVGFGEYLTLAQVLFVVSVCVAVFVIDLEHYLILDKIVFLAMAVVFAIDVVLALSGTSYTLTTLGWSVIGSLAAGLPFLGMWYFSGGRWMGFGDVKFAFLMGLILGFPNIIVGFFLAFTLGALFSIPLLLSGRKDLSSKLPFGTFLALSTVITLLWGSQILSWYLNLISF